MSKLTCPKADVAGQLVLIMGSLAPLAALQSANGQISTIPPLAPTSLRLRNTPESPPGRQDALHQLERKAARHHVKASGTSPRTFPRHSLVKSWSKAWKTACLHQRIWRHAVG